MIKKEKTDDEQIVFEDKGIFELYEYEKAERKRLEFKLIKYEYEERIKQEVGLKCPAFVKLKNGCHCIKNVPNQKILGTGNIDDAIEICSKCPEIKQYKLWKKNPKVTIKIPQCYFDLHKLISNLSLKGTFKKDGSIYCPLAIKYVTIKHCINLRKGIDKPCRFLKWEHINCEQWFKL